MFNEREMSKAIDWLFELFSPEDYEWYDEDEISPCERRAFPGF